MKLKILQVLDDFIHTGFGSFIIPNFIAVKICDKYDDALIASFKGF